MLAAESKAVSVVEVLVQRGADPSVVDAQGHDVLHYAKLSDKSEVKTALTAALSKQQVSGESNGSELHNTPPAKAKSKHRNAFVSTPKYCIHVKVNVADKLVTEISPVLPSGGQFHYYHTSMVCSSLCLMCLLTDFGTKSPKSPQVRNLQYFSIKNTLKQLIKVTKPCGFINKNLNVF